ncbi:multiple sugar transport system permease protein [Arthrobacter pascens]|uniref:carbohydrate ABC transporter permease n=1 Tax=Arthrobacter pascens TaxID=1677 RepID=UPI00278B0615|nr:carbohydrate ABC transporter permease [Arthrobacter pascens]MDQ0634177.1 multiple sugar transport system permease protein [Arthrobacter pascens]
MTVGTLPKPAEKARPQPSQARGPKRRTVNLKRAPLTALRLLILFGFSIFCVVPLVWLLLAPTKTDAGILGDFPLSFGSFDQLAAAWQHLFAYSGGIMITWMLNSIYYSVASLAITVVTALLAAYALATMSFPGRKTILTLTLLTMVLPAAAVVLPLFLEINAVHLTNTAASVILPAAFFPFGVYLAFVYFSTSLPKELLEAARLDGCTEFRLFTSVVLPLAKPIIGLLAFFSFVANWNNYFLPFVMLSDQDTYNLPVGLGALISGAPALHPEGGGSFLPITRPEVALAGLIVVVPIACLFLVFQRFLIHGILSGSVKS